MVFLVCENLFQNYISFIAVLLFYWKLICILPSFWWFCSSVLCALYSKFYLSISKVFSFVKNQTLSNCRTEVCKALEMPEEECELSMGMSGDFELAVWNSLLKLFSSSNFLDSYVAWLHLQLSQFWMLFSSSGNELTIIIGMGFFDTWCDDDSVWRFLTNNTLTYSLLLNRIQTGPTK